MKKKNISVKKGWDTRIPKCTFHDPPPYSNQSFCNASLTPQRKYADSLF
jgi:hypothetical protein